MRNIIKLANDFILSTDEHALPLKIEDLNNICKKVGYHLISYQEATHILKKMNVEQYTAFPAFTLVAGKGKLVLFDSTRSTSTRIFAIAHEIGHIVLKHNYQGVVGFSQVDDAQEREANTFAYQLLAPLCVLKALNVTNIDDIESLTLLDGNQAKKVHKELHHYREQPRADEMIKAYGIIQPRRKFDLSAILLSIAALLIASTIVLRELPDPQPTAENTENFLAQIRQEQQTDATPAPQNTVQSPEQGETVYITRSGERYHKPDCYHIKKRTITTLALADALAEGYTACKDCYE